MSSKKIIIAFDLYGTLLSTESIAKTLASHFGPDRAQSIAATWRKYQLEYTWRLNSMGRYEPFSAITRNSLRHALAEVASDTLNDSGVEALMKAYDSLTTFPDVGPALKSLASTPAITAVVFSNGTKSMVGNSVTKSPDLGPHAEVFKDLITVDEVERFKPAPEVYYHLGKRVGKDKGSMGDIWLVSGNPFDVVGARAVGMKAAWVDRAGNGWTDALVPREHGPTVVVRSLEEVAEAVSKNTR